MRNILLLPVLLLLLASCGPRPVPWLMEGHQRLENFKTDFLAGRPAVVTEMRFRKAAEEIKKSGDLDLLGKLWLTRMALQVAVLEEPEEGEFPRIDAADPVPANRNFLLFLRGDPAAEEALLPERYRGILPSLRGGNTAELTAAAAKIDDPLSRLIVAGVALRNHRESEALLLLAVETASRNGWKRALLSWLKRLESFYGASGEAAKAAAVRRRIGLIES
ncbi:MAG: hypothetical protein ACYC7J_11485 [Syntrophales bacterium]